MNGTKLRREYQKNGYVILKNVVEKKHLDSMRETVVRLAHKYDPTFPLSFKSTSWSDPVFNKKLLELREKNPTYFGYVYDSMKVSLTLEQFASSPKLMEAVCEIFGETPSGIATTGHVLRMDPPEDVRNALDWHQDSSYYIQNMAGENGAVIWVPMHDVNEEHGALIVCPGSHKHGRLGSKKVNESNVFVSEQYTVPKKLVDSFKQKTAVMKRGEILIQNMDLFHRSGRNVSSQIRFSAIVRYSKMLKDDFLPGTHVYTPDEKAKRLSELRKKK